MAETFTFTFKHRQIDRKSSNLWLARLDDFIDGPDFGFYRGRTAIRTLISTTVTVTRFSCGWIRKEFVLLNIISWEVVFFVRSSGIEFMCKLRMLFKVVRNSVKSVILIVTSGRRRRKVWRGISSSVIGGIVHVCGIRKHWGGVVVHVVTVIHVWRVGWVASHERGKWG